MFFGKKKLKEEPLGYWEEKSYMQIIPRDYTQDFISGIFDRVSMMEDIEVLEKKSITENNPGSIKVKYEGEEYEIGFYPNDFSVPEFYLNNPAVFSEVEKQSILSSKRALTTFMDFHKDVKKSYHLQLKLMVAMVPDYIGIMDESAEKMLPFNWVNMTVKSKIEPSSKDLYTIQVVSDGKGEVWLHTHGLCRCGITELEILQSDQENYNNHYNLINTYGMYLIDKKEEFDPRNNGAYIGVLVNNQPVVVTCRSWTEAIYEFKNLKIGNLDDRKNGHNAKTSVIFIYKSEEDQNKGILSKVSIYDKLWGDNPIFFISNEETARMKALAMERFGYVEKYFKDKDNHIIIKIGLPVDDKNNFEHIWFELLEFNGDKFKAKLTQEPYNVNNIHKDDEAWFTVENVTDWIIYTPKYAINPSNVYLLEEK